MSIKGIYDIHCHIVPGVDDGATDIGETVKLLNVINLKAEDIYS